MQQHGHWRPEQIVEAIQRFYAAHGRWPAGTDFHPTHGLPTAKSLRNQAAFPTLAEARRQAGMPGGGLEQRWYVEASRHIEDGEHEEQTAWPPVW